MCGTLLGCVLIDNQKKTRHFGPPKKDTSPMCQHRDLDQIGFFWFPFKQTPEWVHSQNAIIDQENLVAWSTVNHNEPPIAIYT